MLRRTLLIALAFVGLAYAQEPAPVGGPVGESQAGAPVAPAGAVGLLNANREAGFVLPMKKEAYQALFRGILQTTPNKHRVLIYTLPPADPAQVEVLSKLVNWNEIAFERQLPTIEASIGRPYYQRLPGSTDVVAAVSGDPGGVGIVAPDTLHVRSDGPCAPARARGRGPLRSRSARPPPGWRRPGRRPSRRPGGP
jgi:hypothetical protein